MNEIWRTGKFPEDWHKAVIIPIPKPGKDKTEATNYRPIALTSCICKTMEIMINDRLVWFLESNNLIHLLYLISKLITLLNVLMILTLLCMLMISVSFINRKIWRI